MIYFSYNDFMDCEENGKIGEIIKLNENVVKYKLGDESYSLQNSAKKILEILKNESEMKLFLKEFFNFEEIGNIGCISIKKLNSKENILTCKILEKSIYIFIKVIENIDNNISYKMFEHSVNIIKNWKLQEDIIDKLRPIVVPIVIYIGEEKWNNNKGYDKINYVTYKSNKINFSYNMINIGELKIEELEVMKSKVAKEILNLIITTHE